MDHAETLITFCRSHFPLETIQLLFVQTELSTASILLVVV
jgi:hypothetical protein